MTTQLRRLARVTRLVRPPDPVRGVSDTGLFPRDAGALRRKWKGQNTRKTARGCTPLHFCVRRTGKCHHDRGLGGITSRTGRTLSQSQFLASSDPVEWW